MAFCGKCGQQVNDGIKFCPACGAPIAAAGDTFSNLNSTTESTAQFDPKDIEQHKGMSILAYFGPLVLIPILAAKDSPFARYHSNQGLLLCIACIIYGIAYSILSGVILAISWRLYFVVSIIGLIGFVFAVLAVIGIINAVNGRAKELPLIGKYRLLK